jgi:hypothetical protein
VYSGTTPERKQTLQQATSKQTVEEANKQQANLDLVRKFITSCGWGVKGVPLGAQKGPVDMKPY